MSDELKDFRYYADKAEEYVTDAVNHVDQVYNPNIRQTALAAAEVYTELAKAAPKVDAEPRYVIVSPEEAEMYRLMKGEPKAEPGAPMRCPEWLSRGVRDLPRGFIDYQCVLFAGHGVEHESSTGKYWLTEVTK